MKLEYWADTLRCGQTPVECLRQSGQLSLVQLIQILRSDWLRWPRLMRVGQSGIRVEVTGADYAKCNGEYELIRDWRNPLAPHRPTYKHVSMPRWKYFSLFFKIFHMWRFIYWRKEPNYGWTIGPRKSGHGFFHNSYGMYKNISRWIKIFYCAGQKGLSPHCEPWQESWKKGINVVCKHRMKPGYTDSHDNGPHTLKGALIDSYASITKVVVF